MGVVGIDGIESAGGPGWRLAPRAGAPREQAGALASIVPKSPCACISKKAKDDAGGGAPNEFNLAKGTEEFSDINPQPQHFFPFILGFFLFILHFIYKAHARARGPNESSKEKTGEGGREGRREGGRDERDQEGAEGVLLWGPVSTRFHSHSSVSLSASLLFFIFLSSLSPSPYFIQFLNV